MKNFFYSNEDGEVTSDDQVDEDSESKSNYKILWILKINWPMN